MTSDEQCGVAAGEDAGGLGRPIVGADIEGRQLVRVAACLRDKRPRGRTLKRGEVKDAAPIVLEQELHQMAAEAAHAVVQNEVVAFGARSALPACFGHALILMNMFTDNVKARRRGRPPGQTAQGAAARDRLYGTAIRLIAERGYEATTLRDIARAAGVSVGLLYRYFPSKQAIVIALYDELSAHYERRVSVMPPGSWRERFIFALTASLAVLEPHELALRALTPVLVGDPEEGIFASSTAFSRLRVQRVFEEAVTGAGDAPKAPLGEALGRLLYLVHLAVLLWWLLDKSRNQRATTALVTLTRQLLPSAALALRLPPVRRFVISVDGLIREALFGNPAPALGR